MRKNILSLSIAAMVGGLGLAGGAYAQGVPGATTLKVTPEGIGHILVVPYFTAQEGNATLLNIVNTDETNGKAVKVRFRGASNSDDVFDFTLFLSPGDVWAAEISQNPSTGFARLSTPDNSCTLPTQVNRDFIDARVNPLADKQNETREGYVEILNMADIPTTSTIYSTIKHVKGAPPAPCSNGASTPAALRPLLTEAGIAAAGLSLPTTGLFANWSIFNVADATSWSGEATAIVAVNASGVAGTGLNVMHPQANGTPSAAVATVTADPLLVQGKVQIQHFDLPDLSTPYVTGMGTPAAQAGLLSTALAKTSIKNEYFTDDRVQAQTDWVFSLPTRRYSVALDYSASPVARVYTVLTPEYFNSTNTTLEGSAATRKICVTNVDRVFWDRSEQKKDSDDDFVISPSPIAAKINLCGEVSVWSINAGDQYAASALGASVARKNLEVGYADGWGKFVTPGINNGGLPMLGAAFAKATSTNIGAGISGNFGLAWAHRYTSPVVAAPAP